MNKIKIVIYFLLAITMFYFFSQKLILKENFINKVFSQSEIESNEGTSIPIKFKVLSSNYDNINVGEFLELTIVLKPDESILVNFSESSKPLSNLYESSTSSSISSDSRVRFERSEIKNNIFRFRGQVDEGNDYFFSLQPIQITNGINDDDESTRAIKYNKGLLKDYIYQQFFTLQENDGCDPNPCENGGTCVYGGICNCADDWYGDTCSEYHPCLDVDCGENGRCINEGSANDGTCNCDPGYLGDNCEIQESDECLSSYCLRYTEHQSAPGITNCLGGDGSCGEDCETLDNRDNLGDFIRSLSQDDTCLHCISEPGPSRYDGCGPNGQCRNNEECICNDGYNGDYCENDTCNPNPCQNGGECVRDDSENRYHCLCPSNKRGVNCERDGVIPCNFKGLEADEPLPVNTGSQSDYNNNICTYRNFDELPDGYSIHTRMIRGVAERQIDNIEDMNPTIPSYSESMGPYEYSPSKLGYRTLYCRGPDDNSGENVLRTDFNTEYYEERQSVPGQDILRCTQWRGPTWRNKNHSTQGWPSDPTAPGDHIRDAEIDELFYTNCCKGLYERE